MVYLEEGAVSYERETPVFFSNTGKCLTSMLPGIGAVHILQGYLTHRKHSPRGDPRGAHVSCERGTPVSKRTVQPCRVIESRNWQENTRRQLGI